MATALDLLMNTKEDVNLLSEESDICTIDAKTRAIFVPSTIVVGGVQSDKNAERIKFSCPKIVGDNLDLSKFSVRINFENVSSVDFNVSIKDQYICDDVAVDGENVTFSWLIGRNAARYMGTVRFIVCAVKTDSDSNISVEWNTAIAEVPVLEGIEIDQPQIGEQEKDIINQLLELTKNTSAEAVQNVNSAKEQAIKDIQSVSQPDTTLTIEGGLAEAKATGDAIGSLKEDLDYLQTKENIASGQAINVGYDYLKKNSLTSNFELSGNGNFKLMYFSDISDKNTYMDIEIGKTYLVMCKVSAEYSGNNVYSFALGMRDLYSIDYAFNRIYPSGTWYPSSNDTEIFTYGTVTITGDIAKATPWIRVSNAGDSANYKYTVKNWGLFEYSANMDVSSLVEEFNNNSFSDTYKWHYERKNVYCWGDSLTMGYGGNNASYPSVLQSLLGNKYKVFNMGVGGESGDTIACRQGGMVAYLESDTTFTKNIATDFNAKTIYGVQIKPSRQLGNINGYILGNKGIVGWNDSTSMSTFIPTQTFTAKKGTPVIITQKMTDPYLQIICIGQNGVGNVNVNPQSENNYKTWCEVIDTMQNSTNAITIVLSLLDGSISYDNTVDLYAQKKYGGRYIESRQELSKYGLSIVGITPTSQDIERMEEEKVPTSLFSDSVHLNAKGYTAWATIIYWHLKGMGLIN